MKEKKLFLGVKCQWINGDRVKKSENHNLATIRVIINSAKTHQWMLKVLGESLRSGMHSCKELLHKILINYKGIKSTFTVENSDRYHFNHGYDHQ